MEIVVAKSAGFCFGVKRAVDTVYSEVKKGQKIYTYGPIIHNEQVVGDLEKKGVKVINDIESVKDLDSGTIIIRSHGVSKDVAEALMNSSLTVVDATCPFVRREKSGGRGKEDRCDRKQESS